MIYRNKLYPTVLKNTPKLIYDIGMKFREGIIDADGSLKSNNAEFRIASNPPLACRAFYFDFLTGSRIGEPLLPPYPKARLSQITVHEKVVDVMIVEKVNEKHFSERVYLEEPKLVTIDSQAQNQFRKRRRKLDLGKSKRQVITQQLPIDNEWEALMWKYVLGRSRDELMAMETIVDFSYYGKYEEARNPLGKYISRNFRTDLTDGEHIYKDEGISPHILRHLRAFNLLVEKQWSDTLVQTYMGWDKREMLEHYVYINKMISAEHQLDMMRSQLQIAPTQRMPRYGNTSFQAPISTSIVPPPTAIPDSV